MNRRRRTRSGILIDLTSLLDVIFIFLMIVTLMGQEKAESLASELNSSLEEVNAREAEADSAQREADEIEALYREQLSTMEEYGTNFIAVFASYDPSMITTRHLRVLSGENEIYTVDLVGGNVSAALQEFTDHIETLVTDNKDMPVIISLNKGDEYILYRDEVALNEILTDISSKYTNVYLR